MAEILRKVGRPQEPGKVYRFEFYYRFLPGKDPPELEALLDSIVGTKGRKRRDILRAALLGGSKQAQVTAAQSEDSEIAGTFDEMFAGF
ncbi:MAG: hypothetical protein GY807_17505 [Gammaproteobacteria bacterium]|nr:hypothetical protein [Gammaproteobacteria bacterium]